MSNERESVLKRLKELQAEHRTSVGDGIGATSGFMLEEGVTRRSYRMVVDEALESGLLSEADLADHDLPTRLT